MTPSTTLEPIEKRVQVRLAPAQAFALFTEQLSLWWPLATHSCSGEEAVGATFEKRVGGKVVEAASDGGRHVWGEIAVWQPPQRFVMSWHPGRSPAQATRLDVRFAATADGGTEVVLRHDGWESGADAQPARDSYRSGWDAVLSRFVRAAAIQSEPGA